MKDEIFEHCLGFLWDDGNSGKNFLKHDVTDGECEEVFFNSPLIMEKDLKHSTKENRYYVLGRTDKNRLLFIVFTFVDEYIRIISSRDMTKKEMRKYYEKIKKDSKI